MFFGNRLHRFFLLIAIILTALSSACSAIITERTIETESPLEEIQVRSVSEPVLRAIPVETVGIQIGVGSPIPVEVVVSGTWPDLCAQLAQINQQVDGSHIEVELLASPLDSSCPPDYLGLPFGLAIPLNMVEMPEGAYTVSVNGITTTFDWNPTAASPIGDEPSSEALMLAYIGPDGNVWGLRWPGGEPRQLTDDANPSNGSEEAVSYYFPRISTDGMLVAYRRDQGKPIASGYEYQFGLWVYDIARGESRELYNESPAGFAWKPGTHLLAFGKSVSESYFGADRSTVNELANGIWGIDIDSGDVAELVKPERGFALYGPVWSPDGRFLAFDELFSYEGRGRFAMYDFESHEYLAWDEQIGNFAWSPDSMELAYDRLTYTAVGVERIFLKDLLNDREQQFSPDYDTGYAFFPVFSPSGGQIAYLAGLGGPDSQLFTLYVQDLSGGNPKSLGTYESVLDLHWSADSGQLIFSAGPYDRQQLYAVDAVTGESVVLAAGTQPDVAGQ